MSPYAIQLLPETDLRLARVARARGMEPAELIREATEIYLRERGELVLRLAAARRAAAGTPSK